MPSMVMIVFMSFLGTLELTFGFHFLEVSNLIVALRFTVSVLKPEFTCFSSGLGFSYTTCLGI